VAIFSVETSFTLGGTVDDYPAPAQEAIKSVLAADAGASTSAVRLTLTAGSVVVAAVIFLPSRTHAATAASALSAGVLADAPTLQAALTTQFNADGVATTNLAVEEISTAPIAQSTLPPPPMSPPPSGLSGGLLAVIVVVAVVAVLALLALLFCVRARPAKQAEKQAEKQEGVELTVRT